MKTFDLTLLTSQEVIFKGRAAYCGAVTLSGSIGFEADHEPFLGILQPESEIHYRENEKPDHTVKIADGMITFRNNCCTILVSKD